MGVEKEEEIHNLSVCREKLEFKRSIVFLGPDTSSPVQNDDAVTLRQSVHLSVF